MERTCAFGSKIQPTYEVAISVSWCGQTNKKNLQNTKFARDPPAHSVENGVFSVISRVAGKYTHFRLIRRREISGSGAATADKQQTYARPDKSAFGKSLNEL